MYLAPTGPISKIIQSFQAKRSTGDDGISMQLLKNMCDPCSVPIAMIVNMSLEQGIVSDAMKLARVMPVHTLNTLNTRVLTIDLFLYSQMFKKYWRR